MKVEAIVYTSNTGYTAQYAQMLGRKTGLPVYDLDKALNKLAKNTSILYLGWLMASFVRGYDKASKHFNVKCVCGVGCGENGSQLTEVRKNNSISADVSVFVLRGGLDMSRLKGIYKFMMGIVVKKLAKDLEKKSDRTSEEDVTLKLLLEGGNLVSEEYLAPVIEWINQD